MCFQFCSMNPETAVMFTRGHFNQVVFAVCSIGINVDGTPVANCTVLDLLFIKKMGLRDRTIIFRIRKLRKLFLLIEN